MRTRISFVSVLVVLLSLAVAVPAAANSEAGNGVIVHRMTLEEKVGQLFVVEVYGQDATNVSPEIGGP